MLGEELPEGMEMVQGSESAEVQTHYEGRIFKAQSQNLCIDSTQNEKVF